VKAQEEERGSNKSTVSDDVELYTLHPINGTRKNNLGLQQGRFCMKII